MDTSWLIIEHMKQAILDKQNRPLTPHRGKTEQTTPKRGKADQAEEAFRHLMSESSRRGFYGVVTLSLNVQDGHIQQVRLCTERQLK